MALITQIAILRKYVKISATSTNTVVLPDFDIPEWKYLVPILGEALYAELTTNIAVGTYARLLDLSRGIVANMAMFHDLAFLQATITDTGIKTMSSDTMQSAPKWVYKEVREGLLEKASFYAERLVEYLLSPGEDAPFSWNNTDIKNSLFKTGKDFSAVHPLYQPYRTFLQLQPVIKEVEDHYIRTSIGGSFYDAFKSAALDTQLKKDLYDLLRFAVANLTIAKAVESLSVKVTAFGFTVKMADDVDDPYNQESTGTDRQLEMKRSAALETGTRYLQQAKALLNAKASAEIFTDYFSSDKYISPAVTAAVDPVENDDNAYRNGVFAL